jgi:hypothetical protein
VFEPFVAFCLNPENLNSVKKEIAFGGTRQQACAAFVIFFMVVYYIKTCDVVSSINGIE